MLEQFFTDYGENEKTEEKKGALAPQFYSNEKIPTASFT